MHIDIKKPFYQDDTLTWTTYMYVNSDMQGR